MLDVVDLLRELGFTIDAGEGSTWLLKAPDGKRYTRYMDAPSRRITASSPPAPILRQAGARRLAAASTVTGSMLERARRGEFDVLSESPLQLTIAGQVYTTESDGVPGARSEPAPSRYRGRQPWTRWALMRCLILTTRPLRQSEVAEVLGVSQQAVSFAARQLRDLMRPGASGMEPSDRRLLLEQFTAEYPGPRGHEFGWYSLDSPVAQTEHAADVADSYGASPLISGDVAADRLAPWKLPARGRIYLSGPLDLASDGFVPTPLDNATLTLCVPEDPTLSRIQYQSNGLAEGSWESRLVDPVIVHWDLLHDGGEDSDAAAEKLAEHILGGPR